MREKKLLSDYVIEDIKEMLRTGRLKEGDRLPNQNEFARQLGVSRISLREALRALETMNVVMQRPKTGTVILNGDPDSWGSSVKNFELKDEDDVHQMLLARKCVEATITLEAAKFITDDQLDKLTKIYFEMYETYKKIDAEGYLSKDKEFHMLVAEACRNKYLKSMYEISLRQGDDYMKDIFVTRPEAFEKTVLPHRDIYEALSERNTEKIKRAMRRHTAYLDNLISQTSKKDHDDQAGALYYP